MLNLSPEVLLWIFVVVLAVMFRPRYRRCPRNGLLVVYGAHMPKSRACVVLDRGGRWVLPIVQDFGHLSLNPIPVRDSDDRRLATVRIGKDAERMRNAAVRLLNLPQEEIASKARQILIECGYPREVRLCEEKLKEIGLELASQG